MHVSRDSNAVRIVMLVGIVILVKIVMLEWKVIR